MNTQNIGSLNSQSEAETSENDSISRVMQAFIDSLTEFDTLYAQLAD